MLAPIYRHKIQKKADDGAKQRHRSAGEANEPGPEGERTGWDLER
jgi:hypothetical protein